MFGNITIKNKLIIVGSILAFTAVISIFLMVEMGKVSSIQKKERDHIEVAIYLDWAFQKYFYLLESGTKENKAKADSILLKTSDEHRQMGILALHKKGLDQPVKAIGLVSSIEQSIFKMLGYGDLFVLIKNDIAAFHKIEEHFENLKQHRVSPEDRAAIMEEVEKIIQYSSAFAPLITDSASTVKKMMITISVALLLLTMVLLFLITRSILVDLNRLSVSTKDLSQGSGDLTRRLGLGGKNEISEAGQNVDEFIDLIQNILLKIRSSADDIYNAGDSINQLSEKIASGASQQASSTEEISASMEEMASNINQNAANSKATEQMASNAVDDISLVNDSFLETTAALDLIAEKVSMINEIAEKTDMLAINASIEAVRSGEQGKGFSAVAIEVRNLAERSQRVAREISEISATSLKKAQSSGLLLSDAIPKIKNTSNLVQEISTASMEQDSAVEQINTSIQQLSSVTQTNALMAEKLSTASEEFVCLANTLTEAISFFRLSDENIDDEIDSLTNQAEKLFKAIAHLKEEKKKTGRNEVEAKQYKSVANNTKEDSVDVADDILE